MPNWYPIAGSQRLRVLADIPELHTAEVRVCKFDKEWWLLYYLWGDEEFREQSNCYLVSNGRTSMEVDVL